MKTIVSAYNGCTSGHFTILACLCFYLLPSIVAAATFTTFGPQRYEREIGKPHAISRRFSILNPETDYKIKIYNGGLDNVASKNVSSAVVTLNGKQIVDPNEFTQRVSLIEKPVTLSRDNEVVVELRSKPGSILVVEIIGVDSPFRRGDINDDGKVSLADPVALLLHLLLGGILPCHKSGDVDGDNSLVLGDAVYELQYLFLRGPGIPGPYPNCGFDPSADSLSCEAFDSCE